MSKSGWTDTEKAGIFFQIMEKVSPIPWDQLELPEGRTIKAVQMMVQKEKAKVKAARGGNTGGTSPSKKRAADGGESPKKKVKTPRKKKEVDENDEEDVKIKEDVEEEFA